MADWPEPENGQVRALPDERTLRWYGTIGLLDRPLSYRGRTALYGERHLLQVLSIKRLQLRGVAIAEIQQLLLNAEDATLAGVAAGAEAPAPSVASAPSAAVLPAAVLPAAVLPAAVLPAAAPSAPPRRAGAFWAERQRDALRVSTRHQVELEGGALLLLPEGAEPDPALDAALLPLRAWLSPGRP